MYNSLKYELRVNTNNNKFIFTYTMKILLQHNVYHILEIKFQNKILYTCTLLIK